MQLNMCRSQYVSLCVVLLLFVSSLNGANANTCGGNCPGNRCSSCPCGTSRNVLSDAQIKAFCQHGENVYGAKWNTDSCLKIAKAESGGNTNAANGNSNGSIDIGLWQINSMNWQSCSGGKAPCSVTDNVACAVKVFEWGGNTWKLWSTCAQLGLCGSR